MDANDTKRFWRMASRIGRYATRQGRGELEVPILVVYDAEHLVQMYHGGFWRMLWALVRRRWREVWSPRHRLVETWLWWADRTGRTVIRKGERHAADCSMDYGVEALAPEGIDDDCLRRTAPAWIRRWM